MGSQSVPRRADRHCIMSCLRPPNHFVCYIILRQQDWRRPVSLVVFDYLWSVGYLSTRFLDESLVYILRENSGRTEELIGYWVLRNILVCLFASPMNILASRPAYIP